MFSLRRKRPSPARPKVPPPESRGLSAFAPALLPCSIPDLSAPLGLPTSCPDSAMTCFVPATPTPPALSLRKSRQLPCFNILLLGARGVGKSSFLNTLLATLLPAIPGHPSPPGTQRSCASSPGDRPVDLAPTHSLSTCSHSIYNLWGQRTMLNLIDTPGLDVSSGDLLGVDLQMSEMLKFIEDKFDESLQLERQVHRNTSRLGESHVHVSVYFIHPSTITPRKLDPPSGLSSNHHRFSESDEDDEEEGLREHLSAIDLRQLRRLSRRSNILPVIGRSDELTEARLLQVKQIVRDDLKTHGIRLGVFDQSNQDEESESEENLTTPEDVEQGMDAGQAAKARSGKRMSGRKSAGVSVSMRRGRPPLLTLLRDELESVKRLLPLSLIGPESAPARGLDAEALDRLNHTSPFPSCTLDLPPSATVAGEKRPDGALGRDEALYVRKYKWATVDILNPNHCEFLLARAVLLGSHFSKLRESTRLRKYESYRTEKLILRRSTVDRGLKGLEEQKKIAREVEKIEIPHLHTPQSIFGSRAHEAQQGHQDTAPFVMSHYHQPGSPIAPQSFDQHYPSLPPPTPSTTARKHRSLYPHSLIGGKRLTTQPPALVHSSTSQPQLPLLTAPSSSFLPLDNDEPYDAAQSQVNRPMVF